MDENPGRENASSPQGSLPGGTPHAVLAAVLSCCLCGLGQLYNRELEKGLVFLTGYLLVILVVPMDVRVLIAPLVWLASMIDAYRAAKPMHGDADRAV